MAQNNRNWEQLRTHKEVQETCISKTANIQHIYLLIKDHKAVDPFPVPKTHPVVSSHHGMNYQLSNIISELLEPVAEVH